MNRLRLALPVIGLLILSGPAWADYLMIKLNVTQLNEMVTNPAGAGGAMGGYPGGIQAPPMSSGDSGSGSVPMASAANVGPTTPPSSSSAGMMGSAGQPGMTGPAPAEAPDSLYLTVFIEAAKVTPIGQHYAQIDHKWGKKANLPTFQPIVGGLITYSHLPKVLHKTKFNRDLKKEIASKDKAKSFGQIRYLADWALKHGLVKEFHVAMDALTKLNAASPLVKNYQAVKAELAKPFAADDPAQKQLLAELKEDGYRTVVSEPGHYVVWTKLQPTAANEQLIRDRLNRMEDMLETFYYWFALQENVAQPALPKYRLSALLSSTPQEFQNRHVAWGSQMTVAEGFTPRSVNLMVLAHKRQDEAYQLLDKHLPTLLRQLGQTPEALLTGKVWDDKAASQRGPEFSVAQALVLVNAAAEEEAARAAISHEAIRQLLVASGMFPRHVSVPEWVLTGIAGYFETPEAAIYPGVGLPSWSNLVSFKHHHKLGKFAKSGDVLYSVLTDRYFHDARRSAEDLLENRDDEKLQKRAREDAEIARSTAWALVFYLVEEGKLDALVRYGEELNRLPRDLDLGERALRSSFSRAFNLGDFKDGGSLDTRKMNSFADAWVAVVERTVLEVPEVEAVMLRTRAAEDQAKKKPAPPTNQQYPGSSPMVGP